MINSADTQTNQLINENTTYYKN